MKKFKNALIVLLISFAMSFSTWPSMGYAQFFQQENSVNENQTEDNLDNEEVESQPIDEEQDRENNYEDETESPSLEEPQSEEPESEEPQEPQTEVPEDENPQDPQDPEGENLETEEPEEPEEPENPEDENPQTSATVTFKYLEEGTNKSIAEDDVQDLEAGDYSFSEEDAPEIEGYQFVSMNGDTSGTIEEGSNVSLTVNMIYKAVEDEEEPQEPEEDKFQVTYYYIDELTSKEISQREVIYLPIGSKVDSNVKNIENYIYHHTVQVEFCDGTVGVYNFYGRANPSGKYRIKINYLEENTNKVLAKSFVSDLVENNFSYNVSCRDKLYIPGYKYVKTVGNVIGTINNSDVEINVYYRKVEQYKVTINFIDYNTKRQIIKSFVSIDLNNGDDYNVTRFENFKINGYKLYKVEGDAFKGTINGNKVINMYYLKDGETAVLTGDFNNLLLWGGIGIVAILIVVIIFLLKSRKK